MLSIKIVSEQEKIKILSSVPESSFGKTVPKETLELRDALANLKVGEMAAINIGEAEQYEMKKRTEGGRVVGTGKSGVRYPVLAKYETAVKYVNDNSSDGSKIYFIKPDKANNPNGDLLYIVRVSKSDVENPKYRRSLGTRNGKALSAFDVAKWRRDIK
jgi:hypothetical protein